MLAGGGEEEEDGGECGEEEQERRTRAIVSQDTANILAGLGEQSTEQQQHVISFNISSKQQSNILETGFANLFHFDNFVHTHSRKSEAALSRSITFLMVIAFTRGLTIV